MLTLARQKAFQVLDQIYLQISENPELAENQLIEFEKHHTSASDILIHAKIELLKLVLLSVSGNYHLSKTDDGKLLDLFEKAGLPDEAGLLVLTKARHLFTSGDISAGEKWIEYFKTHFEGKVKESIEMVYLTRLTFLHGKKQEYEERSNLCLLALEKLRKSANQNDWNFNLQTIFCTNLADSHFKNRSFDTALPYLNHCLSLVATQRISVYNTFNIYSFFAFFHEEKKDWIASIGWHEKIIALLQNQPRYEIYLNQSYLMVAMLCYKLYTHSSQKNLGLFKKLKSKQKEYLERVGKSIKKDRNNTQYTYWQLGMARMYYITKDYPKAIRMVKTCTKNYQSFGHHKAVHDCLQLQHEIYFAWGKQTKHPPHLYKAYEIQQEQSRLMLKDFQEANRVKLQGIESKYEQYKQEAGAKLLQVRLNHLEQELQRSNISLQEKISLLDEIRKYVLSFKQKDIDLRFLVQEIVRKINSIKLTEQEKSVLQKKMGSANDLFIQELNSLFPQLTHKELRACVLIKTGMNDKELSKLYGLGEKSYEQMRYRIKKKLNLSRTQNLVKFLLELEIKTHPN